MAEPIVRIRLLFADTGAYREEIVDLPGGAVNDYDRLIDWLREDEAVLKVLHVDLNRLCAASLAEG